ncbi:MAG: zinc-binding dehydrogenase [Bacteroidetes bacterium]|nr:zinc-binding dehydrogenase [Bacteroidota bacterium]
MKALVLEKTGDIKDLKENLVFRDFDTPVPKEGEVLIKVQYAALNHRDVWITKGLYSGVRTPIILGSDCAGTIADSNGSSFKNGDAVIVNPTINWGVNQSHQNKNFSILGLPENGTLAEYICIPSKYVYLKPEHLSFKEASAFPLAGLTAYRACFVRGKITAGDNVLITGVGGGVATFAMVYCIAAGANVFVTSGDEDKLEQAITFGAVGGINHRIENWEKRFKEIHPKINKIIDGAGGGTFAKCLDICSEGGTLINYGATLGAVKNFEMRRVFWKQLNIYGSTMGSDEDFANMIEFIDAKKVKPVLDSEYEIQNGAEAFVRLESSKQMGKIIVRV